jgi:hypothetical protein
MRFSILRNTRSSVFSAHRDSAGQIQNWSVIRQPERAAEPEADFRLNFAGHFFFQIFQQFQRLLRLTSSII